MSKGEKSGEGVKHTAVPENDAEIDQEYVIDKIVGESIDKDGAALFKIRWFNYGPGGDIWEPESALPMALVARFRRRAARRG